jgi:hypothetical protein
MGGPSMSPKDEGSIPVWKETKPHARCFHSIEFRTDPSNHAMERRLKSVEMEEFQNVDMRSR